MTQKKAPICEWLPFLVDEEGKRTPLVLREKYYTIPQIQQFFHTLPWKYPKLVGKRIDFEEQTTPALFVVPPLYGSKGD